MKENRNTLLKIVKILMGILLIIGISLIALFPFENRDLCLQFIMDKGKYEVFVSHQEIKKNEVQYLNFEDENEFRIKGLKVYGSIKTMYLEKVEFSTLASYIEDIDSGEMQWEEDGLFFTGNDGIKLIMNDGFNDLLLRNTSTFFQERFIFAELLTVVIAFAWIILKILEEKTVVDNLDNHSPLYEVKKFWGDVKNYWQYTVYAAKTDLKAEVANSYLNRLWWLLEPFFNMLVYVIVFGKVMGRSVENYATFVFSALLMWNFFNKTITYSVKLVRNNRDIVTKVYIPKFILLISNMILNIYKLLFSLIVLVAMLVVFRIQIGVNIFWIIPAYGIMILLSFGAGMIFLHFGVYVDDLSYAVGILLNMLMFLSGIF